MQLFDNRQGRETILQVMRKPPVAVASGFPIIRRRDLLYVNKIRNILFENAAFQTTDSSSPLYRLL